MTEITPDMYARLFEHHHEGVLILEDLVKRYGHKPYVKGGRAAERQTLINLGNREVVEFIHTRINQSHGVNDHDELEVSTI